MYVTALAQDSATVATNYPCPLPTPRSNRVLAEPEEPVLARIAPVRHHPYGSEDKVEEQPAV
jgi:hypothetical protein